MGSSLIHRIGSGLCLLAGLALALLAFPQPVYAAGPIILNGQFDDWQGQACFSDPAGDAASSSSDLLGYCFASNPNDPAAYFMIERQFTKPVVEAWMYLDTDNNGNYQANQDRAIRVNYKPQGNHSSVSVDLFDGSGQFLKNITSGADWGESTQLGGGKVEFGVSLADLGILVGQPVRVFAQSKEGNSVSDSTLEAQWSPADGLGLPLLAGLLAAGAVWMVIQRSKLRK